MKAIRNNKISYTEISKFPAVSRDLALLLDKGVEFAEIEKGGLFHREEVAEGSDALRCLRREESGSREEELRRELRAAR